MDPEDRYGRIEERKIAVNIAAIRWLLVAIFAALGVRVWAVMKPEKIRTAEVAHRQPKPLGYSKRVVDPVPGAIHVSNENGIMPVLLRTRRFVPFIDPVFSPDYKDDVLKAGSLLGRDPRAILAEIQAHLARRPNSRYVILGEAVDPETRRLIEKTGAKAIHFDEKAAYVYPYATTLSQIVGASNEEQGLAGILARYNERLKGKPGYVVEKRDALGGRYPEAFPDQEHPVDGDQIVLSIHFDIQRIVEEEIEALAAAHSPKQITAVVLDTRTADVLAMVTWPWFDPNKFTEYPQETYLNRCVCDAVEPGSVVKPFLLAEALESGQIDVGAKIFCENGTWRYRGRTVYDHHPYGELTAGDVIVKSSNIGAAKLGLMLGEKRMRGLFEKIGFGQKTGIDLPGERSGFLQRESRWSYFTTISCSFGYEMMATPLQLAAAYNVFANDGLYLRPQVVRAVVSGDGASRAPARPAGVRVFMSRTVEKMKRVLSQVVEEGTARKAFARPGLIAGKTGTAKLLNPSGGYSDSRYRASFACFAPVEKPRITIVINVTEPSMGHIYGGAVAAPTARRIVVRALSLLKDPAVAEGAKK